MNPINAMNPAILQGIIHLVGTQKMIPNESFLHCCKKCGARCYSSVNSAVCYHSLTWKYYPTFKEFTVVKVFKG